MIVAQATVPQSRSVMAVVVRTTETVVVAPRTAMIAGRNGVVWSMRGGSGTDGGPPRCASSGSSAVSVVGVAMGGG